MAVVVNDAPAVVKLFRLEANSRAPEWSQTDAFRYHFRRRDLERTAALAHDRTGRGWIRIAFLAHFICPAKDAVVPPRDRIHERGIVAGDGIRLRNPAYDYHLSAMRFHFRIGEQGAGADSGAIDD